MQGGSGPQLARPSEAASTSALYYSTASDVKRSLRAPMTLLRCGHPGCNYSSARKNNLARHQRTHSGAPTPPAVGCKWLGFR